jgi:hypothetical protein
MRKFLLNHKLVWAVATWAILFGVAPSNGFAMPSSSVSTFSTPSFREMQIDKIVTQMGRPEARAHMMMMGISQNELKDNLVRLDDAQLANVAGKADQIKVAGDAGIGILVTLLIIGILAIIFYRLAKNKKIVA